jgi:hypothetical protein
VLIGNYGKTGVFEPGYSMIETPESHMAYLSAMASGKHFLTNKEELGNDLHEGKCDYEISPDMPYGLVKPAFLLRNPVRIFASWKHVG